MFTRIVLLHRLIFRSFRRKNERSVHHRPMSLANHFSRKGSSIDISDIAEVSHFLIES